jgi:hypothetical protein
MPSIVTGIIGGIQGASAAHNAASAQEQGYSNAATSVNNAVSNANPLITNAATNAAGEVQAASGNAGVEATGASGAAATGATTAATGANQYLSPYVNNGAAASNALSNMTAAGGFSFNPTQATLQNTPGYQFTQQQGTKAVQNSMSAGGMLNSGAAGKAMANYQQGLANTTYQNAYGNALNAYNANVSSLTPQVSMGLSSSGQAGSNLVNAAQYGGSANLQSAEYAGTAGMTGAQYAGTAGMSAANTTASNLINAGVYTGNTQIGSGNAQAQGDIGAANAWNGALGSIGTAANTAMVGGFSGGNGFSFSNIGNGLANMYGA